MGIQDREWYWEDRDRKEAMYGDGSKPPTQNTQSSTSDSQNGSNLLEAITGALFKIVGMLVIVFLIVAAFCLFVAFSGIRI